MNIYSFLGVTCPIEANLLVVEGWMSDYVVKSAVTEFNQGNYQKLITAGIPIDKGSYLSEYNNFAKLTPVCFVTSSTLHVWLLCI